MTSFSKNNYLKIFVCLAISLASLVLPKLLYAQNSLSLSVTPTLFEMAANPTQVWESSVKVINSNPYDITVFPSVVNFAPQGETGQGKFLPVFDHSADGTTLAEWIDIKNEPITIKSETSAQVPFRVMVPEDASPGGHFAAILISTQPPKNDSGALSVRTSQIVTSLFFVRIAGDVVEKGSIRSFSSIKSLVQKPNTEFELRFENKGNVHLQPRGEVTIYNMWGKERGSIPINHQTHFGNVLPDSIRKFSFSWSGEQSISDIGRYKAVALLAYGTGNTNFVSSASYFWIVPIKSLAITIFTLLFILFVVTYLIKLYVRKMLEVAGVPVDSQRRVFKTTKNDNDVMITNYKTIAGPVKTGYLDFTNKISSASAMVDKVLALFSFIKSYKIFFIAIIFLLLVGYLTYYFFNDVTETVKDYEVTINNSDLNETKLSSEEIIFSELSKGGSLTLKPESVNQNFTLSIINTSGQTGVGAEVALKLVNANYAVNELNAHQTRIDKNSVIVFDPEVTNEALQISKLLGGALPSARTASSTDDLSNITIFVGKNQISD
jgi:hypothetical protein